MLIVIDLQGEQIRNRPPCIARYDLLLTKAIIRNRNKHEVIIILNNLDPETIEPLRSEFNRVLPQKNIRIWYVPETITKKISDNSWQRTMTETIREAFIADLNPDIVHIMPSYLPHQDNTIISIGRFNKVPPTLITLHGKTQPDDTANTKPGHKTTNYNRQLRNIKYLKHASLILTTSNHARREALANYSIPEELISSIPESPAITTDTKKSGDDAQYRSTEEGNWDNKAKYVFNAYQKIRKEKSIHWNETENLHTLTTQLAKVIPENIADNVLIKTSYAISLNHPSIKLKQIFLDVSDLAQRDIKTGIQRVVRSLLKELLTLNIKEVKFEPVYSTAEHGYRYARSFSSEFMGHPETPDIKDEYIEYCAGDIFFGLDFEAQLTIDQSLFYQHLRRHGVKVMFLLHDLLPVKKPEWFPLGGDEVFTEWLRVITQTDGVISVSESTASDLKKWISANNVVTPPGFLISTSHNGADIKNSAPTYGLPDNADIVLQAIRNNTSFLMVGTVEPRKGHSQTIYAFEDLWTRGENINLIIVGKQGWMVDKLIKKITHHPELNKRLFWLHDISDEFLEKIYAESSCLIAASEDEGFGLPLIEAAQHQLPIIARDVPIFREVAGEHAFYFKETSENTLSEAIMEWLKLMQKNKIPLSVNIKSLTWNKSAKHLLQILMNE